MRAATVLISGSPHFNKRISLKVDLSIIKNRLRIWLEVL